MTDNQNLNSGKRKLLRARRILLIALSIFLFLLAIDLIGYSFKLLNKDIVESILILTSNPFIGLFIGLLITALIQSSSTSTSMIVAIVASGSIGLTEAIPMIMGANIGTTLTSTLVSLSFITKKDDFRKAISAGVSHDFFNILVVILLFPLEYYYGVLTTLSSTVTSWIVGANYGVSQAEFSYSIFTRPVISFIGENLPYPLILVVCSFILLAVSIKLLSNLLYQSITGGSKEVLQKYFFGGPYRSFLWGTVITVGMQSSSVTTSVIVPFVATRKITLKQAFTFILGANVGTTITALIAAMFKSEAAISIALVHLFFNLIGVLIFLPFPFIRNIPVKLAKSFGKMAIKYRISGFVYIILTFFIIPFLLISFNNENQAITELTYEIKSEEAENIYFKKIIVKGSETDELNHWFVYDELKSVGEVKNTPMKIFEVKRSDGNLMIDSLTFHLGYNGECRLYNKNNRPYEICLNEVLLDYKIDELSLDSLHKFELNYKQDTSFSAVFLLDPKKNIIVKKDIYRNDSLLYQERLLQLKSLL